jgi:hypothetical protein
VETREIAVLRESCQQARNRIAQLFLDCVVPTGYDPDVMAWGQYLDLRRRGLSRQFGIYATSAGVQVLAVHDRAVHATLVASAIQALPLLDGGGPTHTRGYFIGKGDLDIVYKVTALVDAISPHAAVVGGRHPAVEHLMAMRRDGGGWPDFRAPAFDRFHGPRVHATACALFALSRFPDVLASPDCGEAAGWLADNLDVAAASIATLAIAYLALRQYGPRAAVPASVGHAARRCYAAIAAWARRAAAADVRRALEATEYFVPPKHKLRPPLVNDDHKFMFLLYSPHCLAALALMRPPAGVALSARARRFVVDVVRTVADGIRERGSFTAAGRTVISSVEHLWLYRLLTAFQGWHPEVTRRGAWVDWMNRRPVPRWGSLVIAAVVVAAVWAYSGSGLAAAASALVAIVVNLVTNLVWSVVERDALGAAGSDRSRE